MFTVRLNRLMDVTFKHVVNYSIQRWERGDGSTSQDSCGVCSRLTPCPPPAAYASQMCDVLNQDLFSACHDYLSPMPFHQQCRSGTCKCGTPCLCSALAHYAHQCRKFFVIIDFRSQISDCGESPGRRHATPPAALSPLCSLPRQPSPAPPPCSTAPASRLATADAPPSLCRTTAGRSARRAAFAPRGPSTTTGHTPVCTGRLLGASQPSK